MTVSAPDEVIGDLLRSAWIVEGGRALTYRRWAEGDGAFHEFHDRAVEEAGIVAKALEQRGLEPDGDLVEAHAAWIESLLPHGPGESELGPIFVVRLGDWVNAHAAGFVPEAERLEALAAQDRSSVGFPTSWPPPPPFEPLTTPEAAPPGDVGFRFGILGDMHVGSPRAEETARCAIDDLNASGAELVVQLGDMTEQGNRDEFDLAGDLLRRLEMPLVTMLGNHDVYSRAEQRLAGRDYYKPAFGRDPDGVVVEHQGFRFAVLDSAEYAASPFAPFDIVTGTFTSGAAGAIVRGALTPVQHELLADIAAPGGAPTFVFLHHPPQPFTSFPPVLFGLRDADTGRLHATCDSNNVWGVFAGHTHRNARSRTFGAVPAHEVGIPRDYPFGYALVDVSNDGYAYRFVQISDLDLLERINESAGDIQRRYARGTDEELAFTWHRNRLP